MKIKIRDEGAVVIVTPDGSISQEEVPIFRVKLSELLEEGKINIVLDMGETQYMSSIGLAVMVDIKKRAIERNGDVKLAQTNYLVRNLLAMTNLLKKMEVYDTIEEAVQSFRSPRRG